MVNNSLTGNHATLGGGIYANAIAGTVRTINNTLHSNSAESGGGVYMDASSSGAAITLANTILRANTATSNGANIYGTGNGTKTVDYSLMEANTISGISLGAQCLNSDPLFVDAAAGNYRLQQSSPAINAGNNAFVPAGITTDLAGNTRIVGGTVDMGAYEYEGIITGNESTRAAVGSDIVIYPNPATTTLYIRTASVQPTVKVYSLTGTLLQQSAGTTVDVSVLVPGIYVIDVDGAKFKVVKR